MLDIIPINKEKISLFKNIVADATPEEIDEMLKILDKRRKSVFDPVFESEKIIEELKDALRRFETMRREKKATITKTQAPSLFKRLLKLADGSQENAVEILEQSIANGWQGIFPVQEQNKVRQAISNYNFQ